MFNFKSLFKRGYDFSQWDRGNFPLGAPNMEEELPVWDMEAVVPQYDVKVTPAMTRLLGMPENWPLKIVVDENLVRTIYTPKYIKGYRGMVLRERSVFPGEV